MCGIVGIWDDHSDHFHAVESACCVLHHRGPDNSGVWRDASTGVVLGHVRLSILELSPAGHQPMVSACGRYVLVFNGEIYNHRELRARLGQQDWRGHSDTETLITCFAAWRVEKTLEAAVGMFALALWDKKDKKLILARDRLGEKPLYYGYIDGAFTFASELKALRALAGRSIAVNRGALALYMRHNTVPAPYCIYEGIAKLPSATWLTIDAAVVAQSQMPRPQKYWSALAVAESGVQLPHVFESDTVAVDALEVVLRQAVAGQMIADVPLGAFLSGGIDSSTVVALMQSQSSQTVRTFSIGFHEWGYDEAQQAKLVSQHLGTDHTELYVTSEDALAVIPNLPTIYDEPFADSSQIPTYLVASLAKQHVTVALSGDGGDELFAGYIRYFLAAGMWKQLGNFHLALRSIGAKLIWAFSPAAWNRVFDLMAPIIPNRLRLSLPGDKLHKAASVINSCDAQELYRRLVSHWEPESVVMGGKEPITVLDKSWPVLPSLTDRMMALDAVSYLPDDILVKVDRAAMAVSLETRVPLLDHRVYEFAWHLPLQYKVRNGVGKWLLREVLYRYVPKELIERPKMGFGVPIDAWLRGPLREWAEELLDESRLKREGYFNPVPVRKKWREHLSGQRNWQQHLWDVLMFQAWLERWQ
ncbi:MAG: asparagine synthase (glutamine-hydrolyzing) [Deltaproteobacteria bacterium]|nr:asparagine synthase (glutamine-hydrolyzing) [Deltaproteobacteria bacterium]